MDNWWQSGAAWLVTLCLLVVGIAGCFLPVLPGHLILFLAGMSINLSPPARRWFCGFSWMSC